MINTKIISNKLEAVGGKSVKERENNTIGGKRNNTPVLVVKSIGTSGEHV